MEASPLNTQFFANYFTYGLMMFSSFNTLSQGQPGFNLSSFIPSLSLNQEQKDEWGSTPVQLTETRQQPSNNAESNPEEEGSVRRQSEKERDRNMISNSLKVFRKFIKDSSELKQSPISHIIRLKKLDYTPQEFLRQLDEKIPKDKNYLGAKFLTSLTIKKNGDSNFKIVFRILLNYYYRKVLFPTVLTSVKILRDSKKKQLGGGRKIREICLE